MRKHLSPFGHLAEKAIFYHPPSPSWQGDGEDALTFDLISPEDGIPIPVSVQIIQTSSFYCIATVEFPLFVHGTPIDHAGTWKLVVKPLQTVAQVSYRAHLIVDDAELHYQFDVPATNYGVGEIIEEGDVACL